MTDHEPTTIGRYKVLQKLGAGAMGAVYLCLDPLLKRKVAVKIVLNTRADSEIMALRFQRESEISAQLNHPNVVTIFDVGTDPLVGPFLTMEFVDGCSLAHHLQTAPPDPRTSIGWLCQVGQAMVAAEHAGIFHRDIKPENILVSKDGRLKLSDFGVARNEEGSLTTTGVIMGTPLYTAPELLDGAPASFATDRWAMAVTAFQTVTGNNLPFSGSNISSIFHQITSEAPTIPAGMPAPVSRVFLKALHRDPTRRYDSVLAFLTALAHALGVEDAMDTRGLTPVQAAESADANPTQAIKSHSGSEIAPPQKAPVPAEAHTTPLPVSGAQRLTGPPKELLKGGVDADAPPPSVRSAPPCPSLHPPHLPSQQFRHAPLPPQTATGFQTWKAVLALGFLAAVGGYILFLHPWPVRFESTPSGAAISVDGKHVGKTPLDTGAPFGTHAVLAELPGFESEMRDFKSSESPIRFTFKNKIVWTDINTVPPGAEVSLGSHSLGISPIQGVLTPDHPQKVLIRLQGYQTWEGTLGPGQSLPPTIMLKKQWVFSC